jgi:hypothetical protein
MGDERHPNVTVLDFRIDRPVEIRGLRLIPSLDIFNLGNENTVLARRRIMYTFNHATGVGSSPSNAERISGIIAPRIIRFGVRVNW